MLPLKFILILFTAIVLLAIIYLNRSYAHIYSYNLKSQDLTFLKKYTLENGKGLKDFKYIALGDSLTYGTGALSHKSTFPYILGQKLLAKYENVQVLNLAFAGATADDVLYTQVPKVLEENPDFITLMIGTNDVHNYSDPERFKLTIEKILNKLKQKPNARILVINIPYLGAEKLILFPHNLVLDNRIKDYNQIIENASYENDVEYFDLYSKILDDFKNDPTLYSSDGFHPSDKGYILWGNLINAD